MRDDIMRRRQAPAGNRLMVNVRRLASIAVFFAFAALMAVPLSAGTDAPMDVIRVSVEKVLEVLKDPALQGDTADTQKKEALREVSDEMFHWDLVSKRVLAKNWKSFSEDQQQDFVALFKDILEKVYADRILAYKDETIQYVSSQMLSEKKAEVETHIVSDSTINLTYRLGLLNGKWGVYDVIVEGVSLTSNYRTQFRDFLADKTPAELLDHLRKKVEG